MTYWEWIDILNYILNTWEENISEKNHRWGFLEYLSLEEMDMNTVLWLDGDNGQIELNQAHFHSLIADVNYSNKRGDNPNILVMFQAARRCRLITKADDSALLNVSSSQHCRTEINWTFTSQCDNCHV